LENLVIVGKLELPDEDWDIEDIEETLAGLRKAADEVQETLEKAKARRQEWEALPAETPEERRARDERVPWSEMSEEQQQQELQAPWRLAIREKVRKLNEKPTISAEQWAMIEAARRGEDK
jgi:hypothetical protein